MELKVCKNCKRLFKYLYGPELCPDCMKLAAEVQEEPRAKVIQAKALVKEEEEKYEQVRDYIMTHPRASVAEIADLYGITPIKLFEWIRDDRLEFSDDSQYAWFECQKCGAKIKSGRLCNRCKVK